MCLKYSRHFHFTKYNMLPNTKLKHFVFKFKLKLLLLVTIVSHIVVHVQFMPRWLRKLHAQINQIMKAVAGPLVHCWPPRRVLCQLLMIVIHHFCFRYSLTVIRYALTFIYFGFLSPNLINPCVLKLHSNRCMYYNRQVVFLSISTVFVIRVAYLYILYIVNDGIAILMKLLRI